MNARSGAVIDTHVLLWILDDSLPARSQPAVDAISHAWNADSLCISIGSFLDLRYLVDSGRFPPKVIEKTHGVVDTYGISVVPYDLSVFDAMTGIPRTAVPDPFDRIIAATALSLGLPLVTADQSLREVLGKQRSIW